MRRTTNEALGGGLSPFILFKGTTCLDSWIYNGSCQTILVKGRTAELIQIQFLNAAPGT